MAREHVFTAPGGATRTLGAATTDLHARLGAYTATSALWGGSIAATGEIPYDEFLAHSDVYVKQATWLVRDLDSGKFIWGGVLKGISPPVGGKATLAAKGFGGLADRTVERWRWAAHPGEWRGFESEPHEYDFGMPANLKQHTKLLVDRIGDTDEIQCYVRPGQTFKRRSDASWSWYGGVIQWTEGSKNKRIAFDIHKYPKPDSNYTLELLGRATGPQGAFTVLQSWSMGTVGVEAVDVDLEALGSPEMICLRWKRHDEDKRAPARRFRLKNVRVGGRVKSDTLSTAAAFTDLFDALGAVTADIDPSMTSNVLPYDATRATLGQVADELAVFTGRAYWRMVPHPDTGARQGEAGRFSYGKTYAIVDGRYPVDLLDEEQFNEISFEYKLGEEVGWKKLMATTNPFPPGYINTYQLDVEEPVREALMSAFAQNVIDYLVTFRQTGKTNARWVYEVDVNGDPIGDALPASVVKPGDALRLMAPRPDDPAKYYYTNDDGATPVEVTVAEAKDSETGLIEFTFASGNPLLDKWLKRRKRLITLGMSAAKAILGPLDIDKPEQPTGLTLGFEEVDVRGGRRRFDATLDWNAVLYDVDGDATAIKRYEVQLQPGTVSGGVFTPIPSGTPGWRRLKAEVKDVDGDVNDDLPTHWEFKRLAHPHKWYWRGRARAIDVLEQTGPWTAWTPHAKPTSFGPPVPTSVTHDVRESRVLVDWEAPDASELEADGAPALDRRIAYFKVRWRKNGTIMTSPPKRTQSTFFSFRGRKLQDASIYAEVKSVDHYGNESAWVASTAAVALAPPVPTGVVISTDVAAVVLDWDAPADTETGDAETPHPDVLYYQCQIHTEGELGTWPTLVVAAKIRKDMHQVGTRKRFLDADTTKAYWGRVRSVGENGRKSAWVYSPASTNPGEAGGVPPPPNQVATPTLTFFNKEGDRYHGWTAKVRWAENTVGEEPVQYVVRLRKCDASGTFLLDDDGHFIERTRTIDAKDEDVNTHNIVNIGRIPKRSYWRAKVRATNAGGRSPWSAWTAAARATRVPRKVKGVKKIETLKRVGVSYDYDRDASTGTPLDEVDYFEVEGTKDGWGTTDPDLSDTFVRSFKKTFKAEDTSLSYDFRIRAVDADGERGDWEYASGTSPGALTWSTPAGAPPVIFNSGAASGAGKVYLHSGTGGTALYLYDASLNTYTARATMQDFPTGGMYGFSDSIFGIKNGFGEKYTISSNSVSSVANVPAITDPTQRGGGPVQGRELFHAGGSGGAAADSAHWKYDVDAAVWTQLANITSAHRYVGAAVLSSDTHMIFGGGMPASKLYSRAANTWAAKANTPSQNVSGGTGILGMAVHFSDNTNHHLYDLGTDAWSTRTALPANWGFSGMIAATLGDYFLWSGTPSHHRWDELAVGTGATPSESGLFPSGTSAAPTITAVDPDPRRITIEYDPPSRTGDADGLDADIDARIRHFQIQVATDSGFATIVKRDRAHKGTKKVFTFKLTGATYYARVRAVGHDGTKSAWSATVSATLQSPNMPQNLTAVSNEKAVGVDWDPPSNFDDSDPKIAFYQVQASSDAWASTAISTSGRVMRDMHVVATRRMFKDQSTSVFDFRVRSVSTSGEKSAWAYLSATTAGTLAWTTKATVPTVAYGNPAAAYFDGREYIFASGSTPSTSVHDPDLDTYTAKAAAPAVQWGCAAGVSNAGRFYVLGMGTYNLCYEYDPVGNVWVQKVSNPLQQIETHITAPNVSNLLYHWGGSTGSGSGTNRLSSFDPVANSWTQRANSTYTNRYGGVSATGGALYAHGGTIFGQGQFESYSPTPNTWATKTQTGVANNDVSLTSLDGLIWRGGTGATDFRSYDPASNTWTARTSSQRSTSYEPMFAHKGGVWYPGKSGAGAAQVFSVLVVGTSTATPGTGLKPTGTPPAPTSLASLRGIEMVGVDWDAPSQSGDPDRISDLIEYFQVHATQDGWTTVWKKARKVAGTARRFHSTAFDSDHDFRVRSVGWDGQKSAWVYLSGAASTGTQAWTARNVTGWTGRYQDASADDGTFMYRMGGASGVTEQYKDCHAYDPILDTWSVKASMTTGKRGPVGGRTPLGIFCAMGSTGPSSGAGSLTGEEYQLSRNSWVAIANAPGDIFGGMSVWHNDMAWMVGAPGGNFRQYVFDLLGGTGGAWTTKANPPIGGSRGGKTGADRHNWTTTSVYDYTPSSDTWSAARLSGFTANLDAGCGLNSELYVGHSSTFEKYDPALNTRTVLATGTAKVPALHPFTGNIYGGRGGDTAGASNPVLQRFNALNLSAVTLRPKVEKHIQTWQHQGNLVVQAAGKGKWEADKDWDLRRLIFNVDNAPTGSGASVELQRYRSGAWGAVATATIAAGATRASVSLVGQTLNDGEFMRYRISAIGSTTPGGDDGTIQVVLRSRT